MITQIYDVINIWITEITKLLFQVGNLHLYMVGRLPANPHPYSTISDMKSVGEKIFNFLARLNSG